MTRSDIIKFLGNYQIWRRYDGPIDKSPEMPEPKEIGIAIDRAIKLLEEDRPSELMTMMIKQPNVTKDLMAQIDKYKWQKSRFAPKDGSLFIGLFGCIDIMNGKMVHADSEIMKTHYNATNKKFKGESMLKELIYWMPLLPIPTKRNKR